MSFAGPSAVLVSSHVSRSADMTNRLIRSVQKTKRSAAGKAEVRRITEPRIPLSNIFRRAHTPSAASDVCRSPQPQQQQQQLSRCRVSDVTRSRRTTRPKTTPASNEGYAMLYKLTPCRRRAQTRRSVGCKQRSTRHPRIPRCRRREFPRDSTAEDVPRCAARQRADEDGRTSERQADKACAWDPARRQGVSGHRLS
jgi:hypothetical protein